GRVAGPPPLAPTPPERTLYGFFPVIPHFNCIMGSGSCFRKSTHVIPCKKMGKSGSLSFGASLSKTGITGHFRFTNCWSNAYISISCQGPLPFAPTKTAADLISPICCSNKGSHGCPGGSCHSSSQ